MLSRAEATCPTCATRQGGPRARQAAPPVHTPPRSLADEERALGTPGDKLFAKPCPDLSISRRASPPPWRLRGPAVFSWHPAPLEGQSLDPPPQGLQSGHGNEGPQSRDTRLPSRRQRGADSLYRGHSAGQPPSPPQQGPSPARRGAPPASVWTHLSCRGNRALVWQCLPGTSSMHTPPPSTRVLGTHHQGWSGRWRAFL